MFMFIYVWKEKNDLYTVEHQSSESSEEIAWKCKKCTEVILSLETLDTCLDA